MSGIGYDTNILQCTGDNSAIIVLPPCMNYTVNASPEIAANSRVAIIGAGITGLSTAYYLQKSRPDLQLSVLEAGTQAGGILQTVHRNGFLVELGPDMFITREPEALELCEELGFADQLIPTNSENRGAFLVHRGKLQKMPEGWTMMTPTSLWSTITTPLLSLRGKLRVLGEYFIPRRKESSDESLASFTRRRLGREAFDNIIQPLIGGIYTADPEKLSMNATLKAFVDMEREDGGLIRGGLKQLRNRQSDTTSTGARYGMFVAPRDGMQTLADAIVNVLPARTMEYGVQVTGVQATETGMAVTVENDSTKREYDKVIVTTSSQITAELLRENFPQLSETIDDIPLSGANVLCMAYARKDIDHPLDAFGIVCPIKENRPVIAISISSQKFAGRAPDDHVLFRVFVGGALQPNLLDLTDEQLIQSSREQLKELLGVRGEPLFTEIVRWHKKMPQYHVGHVELVDSIEAQVAKIPNLELAGNAYRGVGIPFCIRSAKNAVQRLLGNADA